MGDGVVNVGWTRTELEAMREAIEVTPHFDGRAETRDAVRAALRERRTPDVLLDLEIARRFASRLVPLDAATATAKARLVRAVEGRREPQRPSFVPLRAATETA